MEAQNYNHNSNLNTEGFNSLPNEESLSQRDKLIKEIQENSLSCIICFDPINAIDPVYFCDICFNIFHLSCIKKWDNITLRAAQDFTCPGCNSKNRKIMKSFCFCGKVEDPTVTSNNLAHSCGQLCSKQLKCDHSCNIPCHPGPHVKCGCNIIVTWMLKALKFFRYSCTPGNIFMVICMAITLILIIIIGLIEIYGDHFFHVKTLFSTILSKLRNKGNIRLNFFGLRMMNHINMTQNISTLKSIWLKNEKRINELD